MRLAPVARHHQLAGRHRRTVFLVGAIGGSLKDEFSIPGSDTQKATDLIESEFASEQGGVLNIVFAAPPGQRLDTPERKAAIEKAIADLKTQKFKATKDKAGIESVGDPFDNNTSSSDGRIAYAEAQFDRVIYDKDRESVLKVEDAVRAAVAPAGVETEYNGDAEFPPIEQGTQELLGLMAALIVLLVVFRTFTAAAIPIALALTAVASAFLLLFIIAGFTDINTITPLLVSMIGLGVGIDYSLFIVTRFRQLLHEGLPPREAAAEAGASAGRAVLFAGLTVAISVTGLAFFGLDFVTKLGIGSAPRRPDDGGDRQLAPDRGAREARPQDRPTEGAVPAAARRLRGSAREDADRPLGPVRDERTRAGRLRDRAARPPGAAATSALVRLGASDQGTQPKQQTARKAYDLLAEGFGPGFNGPIPIVVDVNGDQQAPQKVYDGVRGLEGVASVREPQFNDKKTVAIVFVTPTSAPQDEATDTLVDRLRDDVAPAATSGGDAIVYVSGLNAAFKDIADRIMERLPLFLLYIIGVTFIVLAMAFRSIVISLTASITTLLSAFVGFGVLTLVIQEGHLMNLTGLDRTGPIETFVPPIAFAILFGLSMDYMVFLMSRIREEHVHGLNTREAVEHGIAAIGRVIVAAALIMGTVFAAFILTPDRISKEFGLLLAVAILTDALARADDARAVVLHPARREDVVHAALARPAAAEHHDRAAARRRGRGSGTACGGSRTA